LKTQQYLIHITIAYFRNISIPESLSILFSNFVT